MTTTTATQTSPTQTTTTTGLTAWTLDPAHTLVEFSSKHMMFTTVRGRFKKVEGTILFDADNLANSSVIVTIDASSLDSGEEKRDGHLRSPDFLHVEEHPTISFVSTRVEPTDASHARVYGELTIRDVTREVVLDTDFQGTIKNPWGKTLAAFSATTTINRKDWGLTWNVALETGGFLVGDTIRINIDVEAVKQDS